MNLDNINVAKHAVVTPPDVLRRELSASESAMASVARARGEVNTILNGEDKRMLVVIGPCSIHDTEAALEYAQNLKTLKHEVQDNLLIVMRAYFEKPRTTTGWKGLINDPDLNDDCNVERGLRLARKLLIDISELGLGVSTEALDPIAPQYLQDLICWSAIGARTTESQTHREMASGLTSAIGFKNGTDGSLEVALNALVSAANPHRFLGISPQGEVAIIHTKGNPHTHIVLRGGSGGPNYDSQTIKGCETALEKLGVPVNIMVDCSHANSSKEHRRQIDVAFEVSKQIREGNTSIMGLMIESNLKEGNQPLSDNLEYGVSVTDACIGWEDTEKLLRQLDQELKQALRSR